MVHVIIDAQPLQFVQRGKIIGEFSAHRVMIENWSSSREGYGRMIEELRRKYGVEYVIVCCGGFSEETQKGFIRKITKLMRTGKDLATILKASPIFGEESTKFKSNQITNMQEKIDELHKRLWVADVYIRLETMGSFEVTYLAEERLCLNS